MTLTTPPEAIQFTSHGHLHGLGGLLIIVIVIALWAKIGGSGKGK